MVALDAVAADGRPLVAEPAATLPAVSAGLEQEDLARRIAAALDRLDDRYREVVVLADMEDASYEQIAATLARSRTHSGVDVATDAVPTTIGPRSRLRLKKISPRPASPQ